MLRGLRVGYRWTTPLQMWSDIRMVTERWRNSQLLFAGPEAGGGGTGITEGLLHNDLMAC